MTQAESRVASRGSIRFRPDVPHAGLKAVFASSDPEGAHPPPLKTHHAPQSSAPSRIAPSPGIVEPAEASVVERHTATAPGVTLQ